jgi:hypothetical protein
VTAGAVRRSQWLNDQSSELSELLSGCALFAWLARRFTQGYGPAELRSRSKSIGSAARKYWHFMRVGKIIDFL